MNFTNTDCVGIDVYWYFHSQAYAQVYAKVNDQVWDQVWDQVNFKMYDQINPIKTKIRREIDK